MKLHKCEIGDCENTGELKQSFGAHAIIICPACRVKAYKIVTHYLLKIGKSKADITMQFFEAIKKGGV